MALSPGRADFVDAAAHSQRIDLRRSRQRADGDGNIVVAAVRVHHIGKKKCAALLLGNPADELPADQRMQFRIFIDGSVDANQ